MKPLREILIEFWIREGRRAGGRTARAKRHILFYA
jgi:hypothetical protein